MSSLKTVLTLALVWSVTGCAKSESSPDPAEATPASQPTAVQPAVAASDAAQAKVAPAMDAAPIPTKTLTFVPSELVAGDVADTVKFCLNCKRRAATYEYCHFAVGELHAAVGQDALTKSVTVKVAMTPLTSTTYTPKDPNAPQPEGGFVHNAFACSVLEVVTEP